MTLHSNFDRPLPIALFGGVYSNHLALEALLTDATAHGIGRLYCLGDLGAFGPFPDRVCQILRDTGIPVVQGNYDNSVGNGLADCQCGYTDARDNYFAKVSYDYTFQHTSKDHKTWLQKLPPQIRIQLGPYRVLLCHGSPRRTNEFLWETATSDSFLNWLFEKYDTDIIVGTHTGLHWHREPSPGKHFINCGAIGRPPNDGQTTVVYTIVSAGNAESVDNTSNGGNACQLKVKFVRLAYDYERLAVEMASEGLPEEFIETIRTGWWTTCNEILPAKERARGLY
ncbi:MAG TPA: metallophosphoesterase family protein [Chthoniobacterales bacterium]|nr:metallophosphoesterase family protein [Chthoniobacterales bacterium]